MLVADDNIVDIGAAGVGEGQQHLGGIIGKCGMSGNQLGLPGGVHNGYVLRIQRLGE